MTVAFLSLADQVRELRPQLDEAMRRVLDSGWFLLGKELEAFEGEFAAYVQAKHCVGVANGLDGLHLALRACGIGAGDEVIVPSNTYIATWLAVSQVGAVPVPVEPDARTCNLDPARLAAAITPRTRAVMPVHLYGQPADMDAILAVTRPRGLRVIEDAAQCHGARWRGRRIGAHGDAVAWSFYPTKNLGALADGGAVTSDDPGIADRLRVLRNYGQRERYVCEVQGLNSRLEELQAAILRVKLAHLDAWNARRTRIAGRYLRELAGLPDLQLPQVADGAEPVWHLFTVRHPRRDALKAALLAAGVQTIVHYPIPPHRQQAYAGLALAAGSLPIAETIHRDILSLPIGPHVSDEDVGQVIAAMRQAALQSS